MAKYCIEEMIKKSYPNNMSADEDKLTDKGILAALSHIQHTRSGSIQRKHNQINAHPNHRTSNLRSRTLIICKQFLLTAVC